MRMRVLTARGLLSLALACAAVPAVAQEQPKIAIVSLERIVRESTAARAAQQKLEGEFARRQKDVEDLAARLKTATERFDKDGAILPDAERAKRQRELADQEREFQRRQRELREDVNQRRNEELASVIDRANRVIKQIAEAEKIDLIVQEAVFASPRIDITEKVIKAMNASK